MPPHEISDVDLDSVPTDPAVVPDDPTPGQGSPAGAGAASNEAPDRDTPAWEGAEPGESVGLVDPRHEIPNPAGL